jgi:hypothetical protein
MITDVAIDLDGVMFDFSTAITKRFSEHFGVQFPTPVNWEFYEEWGLSASNFYQILDKLTVETELFNEGAPIYKTLVGWNNLRDQGLNIHIITHRSQSAYGQTIKWLERYQLIPDSLHFTGNKAEVLQAITVDESASIDDHVEQYVNYQTMGVRGYLFTHDWNRNYPARRVSNLPEFAEEIRLYNQYWTMEAKHSIATEVF